MGPALLVRKHWQMHTTNTTPALWAKVLPTASFGLLGTMEWLNARFALETASDQYDALGRVAINGVVGLTAFGGFVVANHLLADTRKGVRSQGRLAMLVAVLALAWTSFQGSGYLAYHRASAAAQAAAGSVAYADAVKDAAALRGIRARGNVLDNDQFDALGKDEATIAAGAKPATANRQMQDYARSALIYLLTFGGVAFRLPAAKQRRKAKRAVKAPVKLRAVS